MVDTKETKQPQIITKLQGPFDQLVRGVFDDDTTVSLLVIKHSGDVGPQTEWKRSISFIGQEDSIKENILNQKKSKDKYFDQSCLSNPLFTSTNIFAHATKITNDLKEKKIRIDQFFGERIIRLYFVYLHNDQIYNFGLLYDTKNPSFWTISIIADVFAKYDERTTTVFHNNQEIPTLLKDQETEEKETKTPPIKSDTDTTTSEKQPFWQIYKKTILAISSILISGAIGSLLPYVGIGEILGGIIGSALVGPFGMFIGAALGIVLSSIVVSIVYFVKILVDKKKVDIIPTPLTQQIKQDSPTKITKKLPPEPLKIAEQKFTTGEIDQAIATAIEDPNIANLLKGIIKENGQVNTNFIEQNLQSKIKKVENIQKKPVEQEKIEAEKSQSKSDLK